MIELNEQELEAVSGGDGVYLPADLDTAGTTCPNGCP